MSAMNKLTSALIATVFGLSAAAGFAADAAKPEAAAGRPSSKSRSQTGKPPNRLPPAKVKRPKSRHSRPLRPTRIRAAAGKLPSSKAAPVRAANKTQ